MRKAFDKGRLNLKTDITVNDLIGRQRELTSRLTAIESGEIDYYIDKEKIKEQLNDFFNIQNLTANLVSGLIEKIEVGETVATDKGPKRDIVITYSFEKIK